MQHTIILQMGDPSGDGHGQTSTVEITCNLSKNEINQAYLLGTEKVGFDFCADVAEDYEDNSFSKEHYNLLKKFGFKNKALASDFKKSNYVGLWYDSFAEIFLFIVKLGNEKFEYEILSPDKSNIIDIGGYGLFT